MSTDSRSRSRSPRDTQGWNQRNEINHYRRWTPTDLAHLRAGAADGCTAAEIADDLGRTVKSVERMAHHRGVTFARGKTINPFKRAAILDHLQKYPGSSLIDVGRALRCTGAGIGFVVRRMLREGLVRRTGSAGASVRYYVTSKWRRQKESA
jgi:hypothetical protein